MRLHAIMPCLALLLLPWNGHAVESASEQTTVSKKRPQADAWWSRHLDPAKAYELNLLVKAGDPFKAGSASAKAGGKETWTIPDNLEDKARFVGSVPSAQAEKRYDPKFNGEFKNAPGGTPAANAWAVDGHYQVNKHLHEASRVDAEGNTPATDQVDSASEGVRTYPVDVPFADNTTEDLLNACKVPAAPSAAGLFQYIKFIPKLESAGEKPSAVTGLDDPTNYDKNMVRRSVFATYSYKHPHRIFMPDWKQFPRNPPAPKPGDPPVPMPSQAAQTEWNRFWNALLVHEQGHKAIFDAALPNVDSTINTFNKKLFVGEACYGPDNTTAASNRALKLAQDLRQSETDAMVAAITALRNAHEDAQAAYEKKSDHGRTQTNVDPNATNTTVTTVPLAP